MTIRNLSNHGQILTLPAEEALAEEEAMLKACAEDSSITAKAMIWSASTPCIVIPRALKNKACIDLSAIGLPVITRSTGGDITPQGPGVINISLILSAEKPSIEWGYEAICDPIISAIERFDILADTGNVDQSFCDGAFNVRIGGKKIVGTAQRWKKRKAGGSAILTHALLLLEKPDETAYRSMNNLNSALGRDSTINPSVHVALSEVSQQENDLRSFGKALMYGLFEKHPTVEIHQPRSTNNDHTNSLDFRFRYQTRKNRILQSSYG